MDDYWYEDWDDQDYWDEDYEYGYNDNLSEDYFLDYDGDYGYDYPEDTWDGA